MARRYGVAWIGRELERLWGVPAAQRHTRARPRYKDFGEAPNDGPNKLYKFATRVRRGQPKFRKNLLRLYNNRRAVTGTGPPEVLEAAHIVRHAETGLNHSDNGLLLRADIHYLFDAGLLAIKPDTLEIQLCESLLDTPYERFNGEKLRERNDGSSPASTYLAQRWNQAAMAESP